MLAVVRSGRRGRVKLLLAALESTWEDGCHDFNGKMLSKAVTV